MVDVLIRDGLVLTMDENDRILVPGAIAIEENRIVGVGKTEELVKKFPADHEIDAKGRAVLPGFVNVHTHMPTPHLRISEYGWKLMGGVRTAFKAIGEAATAEVIYKNSLVSCLELLKFGSTTVKDNYDMAESLARAVSETGLRGVISELVSEVDVTKIAYDVWEYHPDIAREKLKKSIRFMKEWEGKADGRITTVFSPQAPDMVRKEILEEFLEAARKYVKLTTIHVSQSEREQRQVRKLYGKTPVKHLHDIGMLGPDVLAAHCIYTNDLDTQLLAETDTRIMHCPVSQVRQGGTLAPVVDWLRSGIKFGIGTDNINHDMFTAMRMMLMLINRQLASNGYHESFKAHVPTPMEVLRLATIKGAEILGMEKEIGSLEVGKKADVILVNMVKPHLMPLIDPVTNLVWYGQGGDVETVIVDGEVVMENRVVKSVDEGKILREGQEVGERLLAKFFEINPELKRPPLLGKISGILQ